MRLSLIEDELRHINLNSILKEELSDDDCEALIVQLSAHEVLSLK